LSGLDLFAWIVLIVVVVRTIAVILIAGWLPGHIARLRNHPSAKAVEVAGWPCSLAARCGRSHRKVLLRQIAIMSYVNPF
jgi:hypothetical protein